MSAQLRPGRRAPDFVLPTDDGTPTRFYGMAGGQPLELRFADGRIAVHVAGDPAAEQGPLAVFIDEGGKIAGRFLAEPGSIVRLDANLRVEAPDASAGAADAGDAANDRIVSAQAPVLLIPRVLLPVEQKRLRDLWAQGGATETGVETTQEATRAEVRNVKLKRRRDLIVEDSKISGELAKTIGGTVMSEIRRAFHYRANRFEGFKIGCYDEATSGFFSRHRDDLSPTTAHRRFALSLNLNDDYEGGEVRFPEFGDLRYRPPAGGALIFSGSLLHEVLPVTRGQRFVLLSFLWGDDVQAGAQSGGGTSDHSGHDHSGHGHSH